MKSIFLYILIIIGLFFVGFQQSYSITTVTRPTVSFSLSPTSAYSGDTLRYQWQSYNANSCMLSYNNINKKLGIAGKGTLPAPGVSTNFSLYCTGPSGTAFQYRLVTILPPKPTLNLTVSPNPIIVTPDAQLNVQWSSTYATGCYWGTGVTNFSPNIGLSGSQSWFMSQPPGVAPLKDFVLSITCTGNGGSITKSVPVTVTHPKPTLDLTVSPIIVNPGEYITVQWSSNNATGCYWGTGAFPFSPSIGLSGSISYPVDFDISMPSEGNHIVSMYCEGNGGVVVQSVPVTVIVQKPQIFMTSATLEISPAGNIHVDWYSAYATECYYGESKIPGPRTPSLSGSVSLYGPFNTTMPPPRISIYCEGPGGNTYSTLQFQFPKEPPFVTVVLPYENQYVPGNASKIKLGSIEVHAGLNDAFIDSITVTHTGFSSQISDISHILISQSGTIVSEKGVFDPILLSSVIRLKNPIRIKAGSSEKFDFLVTLTNSVKPQAWHNFMITGVNNSSNGAQGIPTLIGGGITTTTFKVSTLNISIINTPLSVSSGQLNTRIATIRVASGSTRNITLQNFTLTKVGGVDYTNAFAQVGVYKNGAKVGTVRVTTNTIQVTGINALIVPGEISEFEVRADIIHTGPTSNTSFMINDSLDVSATETDTGYDTPVSFPGWSQWITLVGR